jgi:hypothetical protein
MYGCDPEFFFTKSGRIIGSEKIIPKEGLNYTPNEFKRADGRHTAKEETKSKIIIDGIQAELNPRPNTCRANLGNEIACCFRKIKEEILKKDKDLKCNFGQGVEISQEEMDSLSEQSKQFGCMPSQNTYVKKPTIKIKDASKYMFRSAGGHIHIGTDRLEPEHKEIIKNPKKIIPLLDLIVGNTCVLIDRDPGNIERRKNYGKAGEYRLPKHGLEYRTLSNFWLQSYPLMSFVFGLTNIALAIAFNNQEEKYLKQIKKADIKKAINKNNIKTALKNFKAIKPLLEEDILTDLSYFALNKQSIPLFLYFAKKGIKHWFKEDPIEHWTNLPEGHGTGWESFLNKTVKTSFMEEATKILTL